MSPLGGARARVCHSLGRALPIGGWRGVEQAIHLLPHGLDVGIRAVDAGEADVGDVVELAQAFHNHLADDARLDLGLPQLVQFRLDLLDDGFELADGNGPLLAGVLQAGLNLLALEWLAPAVALDHHQLRQHDALDRAEALEAVLAAAPAADGAALIARVGGARFVESAIPTFHGRGSPAR